MNVADSEEMSRHLFQYGYTPASSPEEADLLLLNTCTVRQQAENRALSFIGRLKEWKNKDPKRKIVVTGCAAERIQKSLRRRFPHVDLVVGAKSIQEFPDRIAPLLSKKSGDPGAAVRFNWFAESEETFGDGQLRSEGKPLNLGEEGKTGFVTIMRGCNYTCSYCIVPFVRGREAYRPVDQILSEVQSKVRSGNAEVMLLGQTVNSYWQKFGSNGNAGKIFDFADLLLEVHKIEGLETIRFMSPHPHYMTDKLITTLSQCKKISPQIHLPVQSGSNAILKKMNRNYTREEYLEIANKLSQAIPKLQLSTDFIVGFPGETESDFEQTLSLAGQFPFGMAYCFKYSPRAGTAASLLQDDVPQELKEERLSKILRQLEQPCCDD
ncbi:MAG: tRNA (N6-isopentenyl adenosine(37)-C2)-methylthiotransferase MiaB [Elusimicrobia bacterium]|nr:tRNA (N6-isopentenyl adenosine(37)-C2)-methylthiotransferase MiaB [Elusimicrobiota bacterium]